MRVREQKKREEKRAAVDSGDAETEKMSLLVRDILRSCGGTTGQVRRVDLRLNLELRGLDCPSGSWDWSFREGTNSVVTTHRHDVCHL